MTAKQVDIETVKGLRHSATIAEKDGKAERAKMLKDEADVLEAKINAAEKDEPPAK